MSGTFIFAHENEKLGEIAEMCELHAHCRRLESSVSVNKLIVYC